jgi:Fur family peroxide stress response transcriptional regulator
MFQAQRATMTDQPATPENYKKIKALFKKTDLKLTHQRLEVYSELQKSTQHPSAEDIFLTISHRLPTLAIDTVYRNLHDFENAGIIKRVFSIDDRARFDADLTPHHHFCCRSCKSISDIKSEMLDRLDIPDFLSEWGEVHGAQIVFDGICNNCLRSKVQ